MKFEIDIFYEDDVLVTTTTKYGPSIGMFKERDAKEVAKNKKVVSFIAINGKKHLEKLRDFVQECLNEIEIKESKKAESTGGEGKIKIQDITPVLNKVAKEPTTRLIELSERTPSKRPQGKKARRVQPRRVSKPDKSSV